MKFGKIQIWLLNRELRKRLSKVERNRKFHNLQTSSTVGVVFDASTEANYNRVGSFVRHLQSLGKNVKAIGYVNYKDMPHYVMPTISFDFILKKDLNFFLKPTNRFVDDFIGSEFDILVDFNMENNPVLRYVSALSKAQFKIGIYDAENEKIFDFMLQGIEKENVAQYAKEVLFYLETLKAN